MDEIIDDLDRIINYTKENYSGRVFLIGHSMGGYAVTLFGTKYPNKVDGIITSGALTRYNKRTFGEPDKNISADTYVKMNWKTVFVLTKKLSKNIEMMI